MNDDNPKRGVVIDVAPEDDSGKGAADSQARNGGARPADASPTKPKRPARRIGTLATAAAIAALIGVGALAGFSYRERQTLDARLLSIESRLGESRSTQQLLRTEITEATEAVRHQSATLDAQQAVLTQHRTVVDRARSALEAQERRLADENLRLQAREAELRAAVADVHRRAGRSDTQWIIAETEHLLRIADHQLNVARDPHTALAAMELADQRLRDTRDPGWAGVREQIAQDIAALSAFRPADIAGLSARLAATIGRISSLQIARVTVDPGQTHPPAEKVAREPEERRWNTLFSDLWAGLKGLVRIRERDAPVAATLAPERLHFPYENLKLQLEIARLGLVRGDRALFRNSLETASHQLSTYFRDDGAARAVAETLAELAGVDIRPPLPDISESLNALQSRRQRLDAIEPAEDATAGGAENP